MILLWTTLIVLQQVFAQISFMTVEQGKPVTFQCFVKKGFARRQLKWYKQSAGESLQIITSVRSHVEPIFGPGFPPSRFQLIDNSDEITLKIFETTPEDEGMYHCALMDWMDVVWNTTYLSVKGSTEGISNNVIVHGPTISSGNGHEGNSASLQCSFLYASPNKFCLAENSFYWFRAEEDKSLPNILYVSGEKHGECNNQSCVYHFTKNISSHDMGTYYCAVAACGEILFGNGTRLGATHVLGSSLWSQVSGFRILLPCAAIAVGSAVIYLLILKTNNSALFTVGKQRYQRSLKNQKDKELCCYSAALFTVIQAGKGDVLDANRAERQRIFTAVEAFRLN